MAVRQKISAGDDGDYKPTGVRPGYYSLRTSPPFFFLSFPD
jgi:hypothetical protein